MDPAALMAQNPELMQRIQMAIMTDPELMALMTKPGMMEKFQQMMSNPAAAQTLMMDPDVLTLMTKIQSLIGGGLPGMGGTLPGMGGYGTATGASAGGKLVQEVTTIDEYKRQTQATDVGLVVVDYTMPGCGPCVRIAPVVQALAEEYAGRVKFLKVDLSTGRAICMQQGVQSFPTFEFYTKGSLLEKFSGANEQRLRALCAQYGSASTSEEKKKAPSPYKHFPLKDAEQVLHDKIKWSAVEPMIEKYNAQLTESMFTPEQEAALDSRGLEELKELIGTIEAKQSWHASTISTRQYQAVDTLLQWPRDYAAPGLHIIRMLILHPHASAMYAKRGASPKSPSTSSSESKFSLDVVKRICTSAMEARKLVNVLLAVRALANFFSRRSSAKLMMARHEEVFEMLNAIDNKEWPEAATPEAKKKDASTLSMLRLSIVGVFINYAILFAEDPSKYEEAKVVCLSNVMESLSNHSKNSKIVYRLLVVVGSLVYDDANMTSTAKDLELPAIVEDIRSNEAFKDNEEIQEVSAELLKLLQ